MRYTRFEFRGQKKIILKHSILKFIVLIPIIGIISGFIISEYIISPFLVKTSEYKTDESGVAYQEENEQPDINIPAYKDIKHKKYYIIQTGVFAQKNNAQMSADKIKQLNMPAYIYEDDQYNRVITYITVNSDLAYNKIQDLKSSGFDCIVKELIISPREVSEKLKEDNSCKIASAVINSISDAIDEYYNLIVQYKAKEIDSHKVKEGINNIGRKTKEVITQAESIISADTGIYKEFIGPCYKIIDTFDETGKIDGHIVKYEESIIKLVFLYKETIEGFNRQIT